MKSQDHDEETNRVSKKKILIGASFIGTVGMAAGIAGASWASSSAARDQHRRALEEEDEEFIEASRNLSPAGSNLLSESKQKINPAAETKLLLEGRRLAVRAFGLGTLLAFGITGAGASLIWVLCGIPRSFEQFRAAAGARLPKLTKDDNAEKLNFKNLRELSDYLERQK